ncbi:MAG: hypothetical protein ACYSQZ_09480, partial [Planctomycetota bacterium]
MNNKQRTYTLHASRNCPNTPFGHLSLIMQNKANLPTHTPKTKPIKPNLCHRYQTQNPKDSYMAEIICPAVPAFFFGAIWAVARVLLPAISLFSLYGRCPL